jgi:tetratricopeptide (TPR) repeat protein
MALHINELKRPSAITWSSDMPEDIKDKLQKAEEYYRKADFKKSLEYLLKAWEQWPKLSTIASCLAIIYMQLNERSKAIDILKEAIAIWPHQDVDLYVNLSYNLLEEKRVAEAIKIANEAVQIVPNDPLTWYSLGNALATSGKKDEAVNAYRQTIRFAKPWSLLDAKARDAITDLFDEK